MPTPTALINAASLPANAHAHLRLRVCLAGHLVPYLRPRVVITNHDGWRL